MGTLYRGKPFNTLPESDMGRNGDLTALLFINPTRSSISATEAWLSTATKIKFAEAGPRCKALKLPDLMLALEFLMHNDLANTEELPVKQVLKGFIGVEVPGGGGAWASIKNSRMELSSETNKRVSSSEISIP